MLGVPFFSSMVMFGMVRHEPGPISLEPTFKLPHRGCYFTSWSRYRQAGGSFLPGSVDPTLCTIILYAFGQIGADNQITTFDWKDEDNFRDLVALKSQNADLKILLSVGGWTLSSQFPPLAISPMNRAQFVRSCVEKLRRWNLDGVDLDWEYPTAEQKDDFTALVQELFAAFQQESATSGKTRLIVSAAVGAVRTEGYDVPAISKTLDFINVMTYDFHGAWEPSITGHNSPLYANSKDRQKLSIDTAMKLWIGLGADKKKLNVGMPMYGRTWTLAQSSEHGPGSPAIGPGPSGQITREAGILGYIEICQMLRDGRLQSQFDEESQVPYAYGGSLWVSYDDHSSLTTKAHYVLQNGYAGVFAWELGTDDFKSFCGSPNPLLTALKRSLPEAGSPNYDCSKNFCHLQKNGLFQMGKNNDVYCKCWKGRPFLKTCPRQHVFGKTPANGQKCFPKTNVASPSYIPYHEENRDH